MADTAHAKTDEKLEEMEKRLSAIYSRAEKEIQKTADEYFARFAKQDEAKRKLLEQGKKGIYPFLSASCKKQRIFGLVC